MALYTGVSLNSCVGNKLNRKRYFSKKQIRTKVSHEVFDALITTFNDHIHIHIGLEGNGQLHVFWPPDSLNSFAWPHSFRNALDQRSS